MDEKDLQQAPVIIEEDGEYQAILKKFEEPVQSEKRKKKFKAKGIIIALSAVLILTGTIVALTIFSEDKAVDLADESAQIVAETDANKVWQASIPVDEKGNIKQNGTGVLIEQNPANIKKMEVENENGSFTITSYTPVKTTTNEETGKEETTTDTTQYTLVGYEDFELQEGTPDDVATCLSTISFNKIISADGSKNLADYGLDKPRAVATVTYTDGTKAVLKIGRDALQNLGTYFSYGNSNTVYITDTDSLAPLLYGTNNLISLTINSTSSESENSDFQSVTLSGSAYPEDIILKLNADTASVASTHLITAPEKAFADDSMASNISGGIRGLYAEAVVCTKPTAKDLKKYGFDSIYASISAKYPDTTVNLIASKPNSKGICYLMEKGGKVIYQISASSIPWISATVENLTSDYVLCADLQGISSLKVTTDKSYSFSVKTTVTKSTDEEGNETENSDTTVKYKGKALTTGNFEAYFDNISMLKKCDFEKSSPKGKAELTVVYSYSGKRADDVIKFYKAENGEHLVIVNGKAVGHVYSSYITKFTEQTKEIIKDKTVNSFV